MTLHREDMTAYLSRKETSRGELKAANMGLRSWHEYHTKEWDDSQSTATSGPALGNVLHTFALDPHTFPMQYVLEPTLEGRKTAAGRDAANPRSTGSYKDDVKKLLEIHPTAQIVTRDQYDIAQEMHGSLMAHPVARALLADRVETEVTITFPFAGLDMKVRPDTLSNYEGGVVVVDLKTAMDPEPRAFQRSAIKFGYDYSPHIYRTAVTKELGVIAPRFFWVVVGSKPPHHVYVYEAGQAMLERSKRLAIDGAEKVLEFRAMPGPTVAATHNEPGVLELCPPSWADDRPEVDLSNTTITFPKAE